MINLKLRRLCSELIEHLALLDEPPHELVARAQNELSASKWVVPAESEIVGCIKHWKELCGHPVVAERFAWVYRLEEKEIVNMARAVLERWG